MDFFTLNAAAEYIGLSRRSFSRLVAAGLIPFYQHPFGGRRYSRADLHAYLESMRRRVEQSKPVKEKPGNATALARWAVRQARRERNH